MKRAAGLVEVWIDGDVVVMDPDGRLVKLEGLSAGVWRAITGITSCDEVTSAVLAPRDLFFGADAEAIGRYVRDLVGHLVVLGVIEA